MLAQSWSWDRLRMIERNKSTPYEVKLIKHNRTPTCRVLLPPVQSRVDVDACVSPVPPYLALLHCTALPRAACCFTPRRKEIIRKEEEQEEEKKRVSRETRTNKQKKTYLSGLPVPPRPIPSCVVVAVRLSPSLARPSPALIALSPCVTKK